MTDLADALRAERATLARYEHMCREEGRQPSVEGWREYAAGWYAAATACAKSCLALRQRLDYYDSTDRYVSACQAEALKVEATASASQSKAP